MNQTDSLDAIGIKHMTDKSSRCHDYLRRYQPLFEPFRGDEFTLIEIGVDGGNSLRTWVDYFPCATVIGIDHNPKCADLQASMPPGVQIVIGEATEAETWRRAVDGKLAPSIIIDDGGHFSHQILGGYKHAWPVLIPGGLYIIEDLHHAYKYETYPRGIQELISIKFDELNEDGANQCGKRTISDIEWMQLSKSLAIIKKARTA